MKDDMGDLFDGMVFRPKEVRVVSQGALIALENNWPQCRSVHVCMCCCLGNVRLYRGKHVASTQAGI